MMILTVETIKNSVIEVILENNLTNLKKKAENIRKQIDVLDNIYKGSSHVDNSLRKLTKSAQKAQNEQQLKKIGDSLQILRLPQVEKDMSYEDLVTDGLIVVGKDVENEFEQEVERIYSIIQAKQEEFNREAGQGSLFEAKSSAAVLVYCKITSKGKKHYNGLKKEYQKLLKMIENEAQGSLFENK